MTEAQLAALLRALAGEAKLLRKLLCLCTAADLRSPSVSGPLVERATGDLRGLAAQAEALAEFVELGCPNTYGK
jgi:hypothetical protein